MTIDLGLVVELAYEIRNRILSVSEKFFNQGRVIVFRILDPAFWCKSTDFSQIDLGKRPRVPDWTSSSCVATGEE